MKKVSTKFDWYIMICKLTNMWQKNGSQIAKINQENGSQIAKTRVKYSLQIDKTAGKAINMLRRKAFQQFEDWCTF